MKKVEESDYSVVKDSVRRLFVANREKKKFDEYYESVRKKEQLIISNFIYTCLPKEKRKFSILLDEGQEFYENHTRVNVTPIRRQKITWDIKKLKERLGNDLCKLFIKKEYKINDIDGLIKYLKECGVNPKVFKKFIDVTETVMNNVVDELSETGELDIKDIEGCYTVELSDPYIRIAEVRKQGGETAI